MVFQYFEVYCKKCNNIYTNTIEQWCKPCQLNELSKRTSGNEEIDNLIQEMQLKINSSDDNVFEWTPYDQFNNIEEIVNNELDIKVYSAIWKGGPLTFNFVERKYTRGSDKEVVLKWLYNSQIITNEFLNEVI